MLIRLSFFLFILFFAACSENMREGRNSLNSSDGAGKEKNASSSYHLKPGERIYWVNSRKVDCIGVGPMKCLQVQKGQNRDSGDWEFFYDQIDGFDFEEGYLYKLIVKEEERSASETPADASSINYKLVKLLEKNRATN